MYFYKLFKIKMSFASFIPITRYKNRKAIKKMVAAETSIFKWGKKEA